MIGFFKSLLERRFFKDVMALLSANLIAQLVPFIALPFLVMVYGTNDFAFYFVFSAICLLLPLITTFKTEISIVLSAPQDAQRIIYAGLWLSVIFSIIYICLFFFFSDFITTLLVLDSTSILWMIPIGSFVLSIGQLLEYTLNKEGDFNTIARARVIRSIMTVVFQLCYGFLFSVKQGLVFGMLSGQLTYLVYLLFLVRIPLSREMVNWGALYAAWVKHKSITLFTTFTNAVNVFSDQLPLFLFSRFLGSFYTAQFGMSNRVGVMPFNLVAFSINQVYFKHSLDAKNENTLLVEKLKEMYIYILRVTVLPMILVMGLSPFLFPVFFGEEWRIAGVYITILLPSAWISLFTGAASSIVYVLNQQKVLFVFTLLNLVFRVGMFSLLYFLTHNHWWVLIGFSLTGVLYHALLVWWIFAIAANKKGSTSTE